MKRETVKTINEVLDYPSVVGCKDPTELLKGAEYWIADARAQPNDVEADKRVAKAVACLVRYLEWKP
jgi:hypothetical protein